MKYNFDAVIDRSNNRSSKYDERVQKFGTADVIPLWVADMDFRTAQPIIDACKAKAEEGIWGYTSRPGSYFQAVQDWEVRRNHWKPDMALMSWSLGVVPALSAIVKLFSKDGDKVLIQTPVYSEFISDVLGQFIKAIAIKHAVHQVVQKRDNIPRPVRNKWLPWLRDITSQLSDCPCHKHSDDQLSKRRLRISIAELLLT